MATSSALDGLIILNPLPEVEQGSGHAPILEIGYLDARSGQLAPMAQAVCDLCGQLGYRKMQLRFVARGERLVAMEQAGWRVVRHTDNLFLFGRRLKRE